MSKKHQIRLAPFTVDERGIGIRQNPGNWLFFIHESRPESDREVFFGPLEDIDEFIVVDDSCTMAHIMHTVGIFPSVSQARKNGWNKAISSIKILYALSNIIISSLYRKVS